MTYKGLGYSVIGMTNLPEAKLAREAELCYATVAMVTDFDCWHPDHDAVTVQDIIAVLSANADKAKALVARLATRFPARARAVSDRLRPRARHRADHRARGARQEAAQEARRGGGAGAQDGHAEEEAGLILPARAQRPFDTLAPARHNAPNTRRKAPGRPHEDDHCGAARGGAAGIPHTPKRSTRSTPRRRPRARCTIYGGGPARLYEGWIKEYEARFPGIKVDADRRLCRRPRAHDRQADRGEEGRGRFRDLPGGAGIHPLETRGRAAAVQDGGLRGARSALPRSGRRLYADQRVRDRAGLQHQAASPARMRRGRRAIFSSPSSAAS